MKTMRLTPLLLLVSALIIGCRGAGFQQAAPAAAADMSESAAYTEGDSIGGAQNTMTGSGRKLISTINVELKTDDMEAGVASLNDLMQKYDAYSSYVSMHENRRRFTIKVPAESGDAFADELTKIGKIISYTERTEDVTLQYHDMELDVSTKRELLKTYEDYLNKAESMDEILSVEAKISELKEEINRAGSDFRQLSAQIDYCTVNLNLTGPAGSNNYGRETIGEKLSALFGNFGDVISSGITVVFGFIIYGIPLLLVFILFYWILFGKIGLIKRLWKLASNKKQGAVNK